MKCPHCKGTGELEIASLGDALKYYRTAAGMTQDELAEKAGIGRAQIANIEAGRSDTPVRMLMKLADGIGCSAKDLLP
jgi:transcriptional regulator with XRE-family HTH domain